MAGLDLGDVLNIVSGSERVTPRDAQALHRAVRPFNLASR